VVFLVNKKEKKESKMKYEISFKGREYSVYGEANFDGNEVIEARCPNCVIPMETCPVDFDVEEMFSAEKMMPLNVSSSRARQVRAALIRQIANYHAHCPECIKNDTIKEL
jgi:hypothetical protein